MNIHEQNSTKSTDTIKSAFVCDICHYVCSDNSNFRKHNNTKKHKTNVFEQNMVINEPNHTKTTIHACHLCNKVYKNRNGLWYHKQKCKQPEPPTSLLSQPLVEKTENEIKMLTNLVLEMVKSNTDLQKQMMDVCKNSNNTMNNSNNANHSYNKTFNLQFFLNEQCKDAMNLTDFVDSMELEFSDLEDVGKLGYVEGISKIMIRKLNELDVYKRPILCSDAKREIMYVKEDNVWEKEKNSNDRIRKAIKRVTHKNSGMLVPWSLENPNCMNFDHHLNDVYIRMMGQSMGGRGEFVDNENKIMKKIAKAVFIDKI